MIYVFGLVLAYCIIYIKNMKMKKQKIAIIGTVGLPAKYGGFETLADHLVTHLSGSYDFTVYCSKKKYSKEEQIKTYKGANLEYINLDANGIQSIPYDTISILKAALKNDVLLILGVAGAWILPFVKFFTNTKIIISIDGIEWKRDKWSLFAKLYLWWAEKIAVRFSHIDISDNESIQDYTALRYQTLSRVIEYGADHTLQVKPTSEDFINYPFLRQDYAVKVCRIEPENNVHIVLEAFKQLPTSNLVLVGNWNNSDYGRNLKETYQKSKNIHIYDPIYNQREIDLIRGNASLYVHGHSAGGTNPSLVEAMFLELPIMAFNVSYNKTTTENKAFYFSTTQELVHQLESISDKQLHKLKTDMKAIALKRYTWKKISNQYELLIKEAIATDTKTSIYSGFQKLNPDFLKENNLAHLHNSTLFYEKR
jgi:glycosyltransferase involved in cell wall biosynthesis